MHEILTEELPFPSLPLILFNTETRTKVPFVSRPKEKVTLYTCGPTVYNFAHIGNFRTYVFEDILRRTLKFFGHQVMQAMNITDVDDKTIKGAIAQNVSLHDYVQPYKNAFFVDLRTLGIEPVEFYPCATDYIPHMIDFIQTLLDKKIAYQSGDGSIYFSIEHFPSYGRLSHLNLSQLKVGARTSAVAQDEYDKENIGDFVLWKHYDPARDGSIYWESPFGKGRPGWHLECSTMAMHLLGKTLDLHVGAVDNIFPHHENEIAQSEACSGCRFVRHWLHSEHLVVQGRKMSKSLGNFYTLRDILDKGYQGAEVRYMLMQTHYRTPLNFTFEGLESAKNSLIRLNEFVRRMRDHVHDTETPTGCFRPAITKAQRQFVEAMGDDLNISVALAALFDMMREINGFDKPCTGGDAREVLYVLQEFNRILGVLNFSTEEGVPAAVQQLLIEREEARAGRQWAQSDALRDRIHQAGYFIEDTPQGARLKKK